MCSENVQSRLMATHGIGFDGIIFKRRAAKLNSLFTTYHIALDFIQYIVNFCRFALIASHRTIYIYMYVCIRLKLKSLLNENRRNTNGRTSGKIPGTHTPERECSEKAMAQHTIDQQ